MGLERWETTMFGVSTALMSVKTRIPCRNNVRYAAGIYAISVEQTFSTLVETF